MKGKIEALTEEEFRVQVEAVATKVAEKDYNLQSEHARFWNEISCHKYLFDRQSKEVEILRSLSLDEFKKHMTRVFYSPS